jgi:carbonic anhydrase
LPEPRVEAVLTREERDRLAPQEIVRALREGNERFVAGDVTVRDHTAQVRAASLGQWPKATVLSCIDSRVPVEDVFDRGIGDVFVARVAGNFENPDILGSMEFASAVAGSRVILVLGHENCGAVKGAIDGVEMGNLTATLANIRPAVEHFADYTGDRSSNNPEFVQMVANQNVRNTVADIRANSPILREREERGELAIVGAMYDMESGRVSFLE